MHKLIKLLLIIKSIITRLYFKECNQHNIFEFYSIQKGKKSIKLGNKNIFKAYSKISVDYDFEKQFLNIGNRNIFESFSIVKSQGGYVKIGNDNFIGDKVQIQGFGGVHIGNNCMIAANTFISSSNHDFSNPNANDYLKKEIGKKTIIGDSTWIGTNCTILAGMNIGKYCIIGAGTIITKNIPDYHIAVGNPCKLIKKYNHNLKEWDNI